jgi:hypothetical protein
MVRCAGVPQDPDNCNESYRDALQEIRRCHWLPVCLSSCVTPCGYLPAIGQLFSVLCFRSVPGMLAGHANTLWVPTCNRAPIQCAMFCVPGMLAGPITCLRNHVEWYMSYLSLATSEMFSVCELGSEHCNEHGVAYDWWKSSFVGL